LGQALSPLAPSVVVIDQIPSKLPIQWTFVTCLNLGIHLDLFSHPEDEGSCLFLNPGTNKAHCVAVKSKDEGNI
jgi:hypothetical protein